MVVLVVISLVDVCCVGVVEDWLVYIYCGVNVNELGNWLKCDIYVYLVV